MSYESSATIDTNMYWVAFFSCAVEFTATDVRCRLYVVFIKHKSANGKSRQQEWATITVNSSSRQQNTVDSSSSKTTSDPNAYTKPNHHLEILRAEVLDYVWVLQPAEYLHLPQQGPRLLLLPPPTRHQHLQPK